MFTSFKDHFGKRTYVSLRLLLSVTVIKHRITEWLRLEDTSVCHTIHLETVFQPHVSLASTYLQEWRVHNLLCEFSITLTERKCFLVFRKSLLCFNMCPLPLVILLGTSGKSLALHLPFRFLYSLLRSPLSLLQTEQSQLSACAHSRDAPVP